MASKVLRSDKPLPEFPRNLAVMLNANASRFSERPLYQEVRHGAYQPLSWRRFQQDVARIQDALITHGLKPGDRVAILSPNRQEMLELELSVMSVGAVAVPIFSGYSAQWAQMLVEFCGPRFVAVADSEQFRKLHSPTEFELVIHFDPLDEEGHRNALSLDRLVSESTTNEKNAGEDVPSDSTCLMMYTSGTMGKPKCVQLTHANILSQQAAMQAVWQLDHTDRFLSYLPWHHSFGGIYEKFAAIYNGAMLALEGGYGKDIELLLENWRRVKPTVFFSVPRIYQQIATRVMQNPAVGEVIFHDELRFIFTAAAALPKPISDMFEHRGITIYEGWGLTETSPCCTVTDPTIPREPGVVGKPIPGVSLKLADDGEILVQGPNVMKGYYHDQEATARVLSRDGWFATGDVGAFTDAGLRLICRKDRIFKLSNAEKVVPTELEKLIVEDCAFLSHAYVTGNGRDYPVVLLFPNKAMFNRIHDESRLKSGCGCPPGIKDLARCLTHCLAKLNETIDPKYTRLQAAMLIDYELSIESGELTPSMKLAPNVVGRVFKAKIERLYSEARDHESQDVYILDLKPK
ncbi:MAG TPA: AMP-binding protein [Candidatus Deferrimicrobium sp.]|nr:AMP-binding protein [Candidatus Deferrimicrobium sp.]